MYFSLGQTDWAATIAGGGDYATGWHVHDCVMLMIPRAGTLRFALDGRGRTEQVLRPGEALVVAAGVGHRTRSGDAGHRHLALYAKGGRIEGWLPRDAGWRAGPLPPTLLPLLGYRDSLGPTGERARLADQLILTELAERGLPTLPRDQGAALIRAVAAHLAADPAARHDLDALAARFGVSRRHLTRLFRRHFNDGVGGYLARLRVDTATRHLAAGADVTAAAEAVGLASPSHLARLFRRHAGHAPKMARSGLS
ncbi:helix-turn-helix domain-containing protein [Roseomonas sp. CAU 1739]|uniref:helix-turn-helix transcriptional regulator n=1 Tax=Roseomonas sp. CAU 1739 TaxID=3140364 RepID=UPI00325B0F12